MCSKVKLFFLSLLSFFLNIFICYGNFDKLRFLENVDEKIIELLAKPKTRNAEYILDQIDLFNHCLNKVIEMMKLKTPDFAPTAKYYIEVGGPSCIQQPIDEEYLQAGFGWSDEKLHEFKTLFTETALKTFHFLLQEQEVPHLQNM